MTVNYDRLESDVRHYLSSPESEGVWGKLTNSVLMNVVGVVVHFTRSEICGRVK